jgi:preprotein translocase subunit SecA
MLEEILEKTTKRELYNYRKIVEKINNFESSIRVLNDEELKAKTVYFRGLLANQDVEEIQAEAFAVVREASLRVLGLRHYDVQLIGGCILHDGKIAEMKTGEGKTLVAILAAYLNALTGKSVHIVTVNEYLAKRDSLSVGKVITFLGLSVGLILADMNKEARKKNYSCDVIYSTNSELGFDYLRDNMITSPSEKVQKGFAFGIIDEVDSVLIDEARTPLVISQSFETSNDAYVYAKSIADALEIDIHYEIDKKNRNIFLTENGTKVAEKILRIESIYSFNQPWALYILNALRAKAFYIRDKDYLVMNNKISIVDEFTGRVLSGRRWGEGLHQAIEAKENVPIESETITMASITYQNFFLFYKKLAGMTGTASTEAKEFKKIYNLSVNCVPTNKRINRIDKNDVVYKSLYAKWRAVLYEALDIHSQGRPILIGTSNVKNSEIVSDLLKEYNIKHSLLNAKPENAANESEIIAQAGRERAVTIATNMAGRGTDILLGGNPDFLAKGELKHLIKSKFSNEHNKKFNSVLIIEFENEYKKSIRNIKEVDELIEKLDGSTQAANSFEKTMQELYKEIKSFYEKKCHIEKEEVIRLGGLHIIGTEKYESRRIDNQLRGRAGRQGDPGSSKFFLSFEDNLIEIFGGSRLKNVMKRLDLNDNQPVEGKAITASIEKAQETIETKNYEMRKSLCNFDAVLNTQRKVIYGERDRFLNIRDLKSLMLQYFEKSVDELAKEIEGCASEKDKSLMLQAFCKRFICLPYSIDSKLLDRMTAEEVREYLNTQMKISYELKELELESLRVGLLESLEYAFLLQSIDQIWKDQLARMDLLKDGISWRAYGQKDPLLEYQKEAYRIFSLQTKKIRNSASHLIMCSTSFA